MIETFDKMDIEEYTLAEWNNILSYLLEEDFPLPFTQKLDTFCQVMCQVEKHAGIQNLCRWQIENGLNSLLVH